MVYVHFHLQITNGKITEVGGMSAVPNNDCMKVHCYCSIVILRFELFISL